MKLAGLEASGRVVVRADPQLQLSEADSAHRWEVIGQICELQTKTSKLARDIGSLVDGLASLEESVKGVEAFDDGLQKMLTDLLGDARQLAFRQGGSNSALSGAYRSIESSPFAPTAIQARVLEETTAAHVKQVQALEGLLETRVPALEKQMNDKGIPRVVVRDGGR